MAGVPTECNFLSRQPYYLRLQITLQMLHVVERAEKKWTNLSSVVMWLAFMYATIFNLLDHLGDVDFF